ncbi:MAG: hypothetical protein WB816_16435 [Methylocystis sp.]
MKQPWLKFYPSDWRADPASRSCSLAARGLWIEMLCLMHEARPHGSLLVVGKAVTPARLASLVGAGADEVARLLAELEEAGVFSRDVDGVIYSRRMRRDEEKSAVNRVNGKAGGNPALKGSVKPGVKAQKPEARLQKLEPENSAAPEPETSAASKPSLRAEGEAIQESHEAPGLLRSARNDGVCGARLDEVEAACRAALGEAAPVDPVIGPMLPVVEKFGAARVGLELASQARRKRRRPVKSWRLWAEIVCESLAEEPRGPPEPGDTVELLHCQSVPRAAVLAAIERWNAGGDWPSSLGGPPRRHGCALPEEFLALCVETT